MYQIYTHISSVQSRMFKHIPTRIAFLWLKFCCCDFLLYDHLNAEKVEFLRAK